MKKTFTLFSILSLTFGMQAQDNVSNPSFENWSDYNVKDSLDGWMTSTLQNQYQGIDVNNAYQISPGYAGSYGFHLETVLWWNDGSGQNDTLFGYAVKENVNGGYFQGWPYTDTVDTFTGWYKCDVEVGDTAVAIINLSKAGTVYSQTVYKFFGTQSTWTAFSFPLMVGATEEPDSVWVGFASSDPFTPGVAKPGSWLEIDALAFEFNAGSVTPAAIPNGGFENMIYETIEQPDDWFTFDPIVYNMFGAQAIAKSTDAAAGTYSLEITNTFEYAVNGIPALVTNGYFNIGSSMIMGGAPFIAQPTQFSGQYKYSPSLSDTGFVMLELWNAGSGMLVQAMDTCLSASTWTPFTIDIAITEAPDSVRVTMFAGNNFGSVLKIDDLQFTGGDVSVEELPKSGASWTYYPNPTNDMVNIVLTEPAQVEIIDITGKTVYNSYNPESGTLNVYTSEWNSGVYFIRVNHNGSVETKKLVVRH